MEISSPSARCSKAEETISSVADFAEKRKIEESEMKAKAKTIISERITDNINIILQPNIVIRNSCKKI